MSDLHPTHPLVVVLSLAAGYAAIWIGLRYHRRMERRRRIMDKAEAELMRRARDAARTWSERRL